MSRPTQAVIKLQNLKDNYLIAKAHSQTTYAVIKANAYGHGLVACAQALDCADGFAVACMDEALQLRAANIEHSILVLEGGYDREEWQQAAEHNIDMALHHQSQLDILVSESIFQNITLWLKIDTGMNRLGFRLDECQHVLAQCRSAGLNVRVLMSHFACADDIDNDKTPQQAEALLLLFQQQKALSPKLKLSSNNSAAILHWPNVNDNISRSGIMLYGSSPFVNGHSSTQHLKPVMTLTAQIIASHIVPTGESVGYSESWVASKDTKVAIVAIGYGDGYPRSAPSGTPVWCQGKYLQTLGRVSMDMLCIDISNHDDIDIGSEVELWGEHIDVNAIAKRCNTISYELFCQLTPRVKRVYK